MDMIDQVEKHFSLGNYQIASDAAEKTRKRIKRYRKNGLEQSGEYSPENLAFKNLRKSGYLEKLSELALKSYDKTLSIPENRQNNEEVLKKFDIFAGFDQKTRKSEENEI